MLATNIGDLAAHFCRSSVNANGDLCKHLPDLFVCTDRVKFVTSNARSYGGSIGNAGAGAARSYIDFLPNPISDLRKDGMASLIALPQDMRGSYVRHLLGILSPDTQILLVTLDYSQLEMSGPPFPVSVSEVEELFSEHSKICLLARLDVLDRYPHFYERGVSKLYENIFLLTLNK